MAKAKNPLAGWAAAASIGVSLSWFMDKPGPRARSKSLGGSRVTERLRWIRTVNQVVWDRFPTLPLSVRQEWARYARLRPARHGGGFFVHPAQLVYTACNIIPYDSRGIIYDDPPWSDIIVSPSSLSVVRLVPSGLVEVSAAWASPPPADTLLDVWAVVQVNPSFPLRAWRGASHAAYLGPGALPAVLALPAGLPAIVGVRTVSPRGLTVRTFFPFVV